MKRKLFSIAGTLGLVSALVFVVLGCAGTPPVTTENVSQGKNFFLDRYQPYHDKSKSLGEQSYLLDMIYIECEDSYEERYRITLPGTADNGTNTIAAGANLLLGGFAKYKTETDPVGIWVGFGRQPRLCWLPSGERTFVLNEEHWDLVGRPAGADTGGTMKIVKNIELDRQIINLEAGRYYYIRNDEAKKMVIEELTRGGGSIKIWDKKLETEVEIPMSAVIDGIDAHIAAFNSKG